MDFIQKLKDVPEMLNKAADSMKDASGKLNKAMTGEPKKILKKQTTKQNKTLQMVLRKSFK